MIKEQRRSISGKPKMARKNAQINNETTHSTAAEIHMTWPPRENSEKDFTRTTSDDTESQPALPHDQANDHLAAAAHYQTMRVWEVVNVYMGFAPSASHGTPRMTDQQRQRRTLLLKYLVRHLSPDVVVGDRTFLVTHAANKEDTTPRNMFVNASVGLQLLTKIDGNPSTFARSIMVRTAAGARGADNAKAHGTTAAQRNGLSNEQAHAALRLLGAYVAAHERLDVVDLSTAATNAERLLRDVTNGAGKQGFSAPYLRKILQLASAALEDKMSS